MSKSNSLTSPKTLLFMCLAITLTLWGLTTLAQDKKKTGVKVSNNRATLEEGFKFQRLSEKTVHVVKNESDPVARRRTAETVEISCFCKDSNGAIQSCPVILENNTASCGSGSACGKGAKCSMSAIER